MLVCTVNGKQTSKNKAYKWTLRCWVLNYTKIKCFFKTAFQLMMELNKDRDKGKDEKTQEDYQTSAKIQSRCQVVFKHCFISNLFLSVYHLHC